MRTSVDETVMLFSRLRKNSLNHLIEQVARNLFDEMSLWSWSERLKLGQLPQEAAIGFDFREIAIRP